jgi:hypothetical protein
MLSMIYNEAHPLMRDCPIILPVDAYLKAYVELSERDRAQVLWRAHYAMNQFCLSKRLLKHSAGFFKMSYFPAVSIANAFGNYLPPDLFPIKIMSILIFLIFPDANDVQESEAMMQVIHRLSELAQKNVGDDRFHRSYLMAYRFERLKRPVTPNVRNFFDRFEALEPKLEERFYMQQYLDLSPTDREKLRTRVEQAMFDVTEGDITPTAIHSRALFGKF